MFTLINCVNIELHNHEFLSCLLTQSRIEVVTIMHILDTYNSKSDWRSYTNAYLRHL